MDLTPFAFGLYKVVKYFPYPLSWVVILLTMTTCLLLLPSTLSRLRWARAGACASLFVLLLISSPLLSSQFIGVLEAVYPTAHAPADRAYDAIVVLGGGVLDRGTLPPTSNSPLCPSSGPPAASTCFFEAMRPNWPSPEEMPASSDPALSKRSK